MAKKAASAAYRSLKQSMVSVRNRMRREKRAAENTGNDARAKAIHAEWVKLRGAHRKLGFGMLDNLQPPPPVRRKPPRNKP